MMFGRELSVSLRVLSPFPPRSKREEFGDASIVVTEY